MSSNIELTRAEILQRLAQRDSMITLFGTAFTVVLGYSIDRSSYELLLSIPGLALTFVLFTLYYDANVEFLHIYAARIGGKDCWDASPERTAYSQSKFKWFFVIAQVMVFAGSSTASLCLNVNLAYAQSFMLRMFWIIDLFLTLFIVGLLIYMRCWRHRRTQRQENENGV